MRSFFAPLLLLGLVSGPATSPAQPMAAAQQVAPSAAGVVNFQLDVDPDQAAALKAAIAKIRNARVAEPADYKLTTKPDFPQSLRAVDLREPKEDWQYDFSGGGSYAPQPRTLELGNLLLGDYQDKLSALVAKTSAAKTLMAVAHQKRSVEMETCLQATAVAYQCSSDPFRVSDEGFSQIFSAGVVRNHGKRALYVALYMIDPAHGVHRLTLDGPQPVSAGGAVNSRPMSDFTVPRGHFQLVTFWSDRPFDADAAAAGTAIPGLSTSLTEFYDRQPPAVGVGGGVSVALVSAPWIAQIYSTLPYTQAEKDADAQKPEAERQFLDQLTDEQLAHRCGGTLIAPNLVVTAAHCVAKDHYAGAGMKLVLKERRVRVGTSELGTGGTTYAIVGLTVPTSYNPVTHVDDIALLLLAPDRSTKHVRTSSIAIGDTPLAVNAPVATFGWGYTEAAAAGSSLRMSLTGDVQESPDQLQMGELKALPVSLCQKDLGDELRPGMVCVSGRGKVSVFTCLGDSGGPLVRGSGRHEELVGVTSWANGCGLKDNPDVFTDVTRQAAWIAAARKELVPGFAQPVPEPDAGASAARP